MRGRKPKLTFALQEKIVGLVRAGNYLETAAGACGIHRTTLFRWLEKGEKQSRGRYHEFCVAVRQAKDECVARNQMVISKEAQTNWKAAAWYLERAAPQRYGKQYNAGKREMAEQMLAQLESTLEPAKFADLLRRLQGPPPEQPKRTTEEIIEDLRRRLEGKGGSSSDATSDPSREGGGGDGPVA